MARQRFSPQKLLHGVAVAGVKLWLATADPVAGFGMVFSLDAESASDRGNNERIVASKPDRYSLNSVASILPAWRYLDDADVPDR